MHVSKLYPNICKDIIIRGITQNSKDVRKNYIFVAIKGKNDDGNRYIDEAINNGACLIVTNHRHNSDNYIYTNNPKMEYIRLLQLFYHYNNSIYTIGVTGTDGKTTISSFLKSIFSTLNNSGTMGTNGIDYLDYHINTNNTTPSIDLIYKSILDMQYNQIKDLIIEVSSEGIIDHRVDNLSFNGAIISNLTHEHLNSHKTMHKYFVSKMKFIKTLNEKSLLIYNNDNEYTRLSKYFTKGLAKSYGFNNADYQITDYIINLDGSIFNVSYQKQFLGTFKTHLFGKYNISNALAAIAYTYEMGIPIENIKLGISNLINIDGRFMKYEKNGIVGIVDFAHTPNAINNLLDNIRIVSKGRIILVLGAQGFKDVSKRAIMGKIASTKADIIIFTSEDPKGESLFGILSDLTKKIKNKDYYISLDRKQAIKLASRLAKANDYIIVTGKGNEKEEIILNYHFKHNDYEILKEALDT